MRTYIVAVGYDRRTLTRKYEIAGVFSLDGMMNFINDELNYHDGAILDPIFRVFVGRLNLPIDKRSMKEPHFTIHCRMMRGSEVFHFSLNDGSLVLSEDQLREVIERKYDPENYI